MTEILSADYHERDAIALRAYEIWQRRGCPQGSALRDWYEAETELRNERRARLEATRLFEPPAPLDIAPPTALTPSPVLSADGSPAEAPASRRRRTPAKPRAEAASAGTRVARLAVANPGTRVTRKRPARPDA